MDRPLFEKADIRWQWVYNTSSEVIPPYAAMEIVDRKTEGGRLIYNVRKPTTDTSRQILFNNLSEIPAADYGLGTYDLPYLVASSTNNSTVELLEVKAGSWKLGEGSQFEVQGDFVESEGEYFAWIKEIRNDPGFVMMRGRLVGAMATTDGTKSIDSLVLLQGVDPRTDISSTSETITGYNVHDWEGDDNAWVVVVWNKTEEHWDMLQVTCPA
jgi:hypothetical protein